MAENVIERRRVFIGDIYYDPSSERNFETKNSARKIKENVLLISFGNYFVEFNDIKGRLHFDRLHALSDFKSNSKYEYAFLDIVANERTPYFVKNAKHYFNTHFSSGLTYEDLYSLSFYVASNADYSF